MLELYVGNERIERKLHRLFNSYIINTGFKPVTKQTEQGRLDWNATLESQCLDENRNDMIVDVIRYFKNRNFLVLCKRVEQGKILTEKLEKYGEDVDIFIGSSKKYNRESRILISSYSKTGCGFDAPKLDALIIASDVEEGIEQYVGRVFRRDDVRPMIFDFVDKMHTMFRHFCTRRRLYESIGSEVKKFETCFPEFNKWRTMNK
jgi:superfamily II DNA or RNA helicase